MQNAPGQGRRPRASTIAESQRNSLPDPELRRLPPAPAHLDDIAKGEWARVGKMLLDAGLFTKLDITALSTYCVAYSRWVSAESSLQQFGTVIVAPSGFPVQSPYMAIANKAMDQMLRLMSEFGLTPAARVRIPSTRKDTKTQRKITKHENEEDPRAALRVLTGGNNRA